MKGIEMHTLRLVQINGVAQRNIATFEGISEDAKEFFEATVSIGGLTHWGYGETPQMAEWKMWLMVWQEMVAYERIIAKEKSYTTWHKRQVVAMETALMRAWFIA